MELEKLKDENRQLRQALCDIVEPVKALERELLEGQYLNSDIAFLLSDPEYYRDLAREALAKIPER